MENSKRWDTPWDEAFLQQRDDDARQQAFEQRTDADWQAAVRQMLREVVDALRGFESCPAGKCRRARRCLGDPDACLKQLEVSLPPDLERDHTEQVYAEIQEDRRAAHAGSGCG